MKQASQATWFQKGVILLFAIILFAPLATMLISPQPRWSDVEKRKLADPPPLPQSFRQLPQYFQGLESFINDNFGLREVLINRYYRELRKRFGITDSSKRVLEGKDGWRYYVAEGQLEDFQGKKVRSEDALEQWIAEAKAKQEWLAARGIKYLLAIAPNKHSIYPEYLPQAIAQLAGTSRYQQLQQALEKEPLDFLVDLHTPLIKAKEQYTLYHKNDTHWNLRGAYTAYLAIIEQLQQLFPDEEFRTSFRFGEDKTEACSPKVGCDLARMARVEEESVETYPTLDDNFDCRYGYSVRHYQFSDLDISFGQMHFLKRCRNRQLKAVIFRDSFMISLQPFLSENFREAVYLWKPFSQKNMEELMTYYQPDVVIEEVVERNF